MMLAPARTRRVLRCSMLRFAVCLLLTAIASGCTIGAPPPEPLAGGAAPRIDPCANATKENLSSECIQPNPDAERIVGQPCELHPGFFLQLDTVRFAGGFVS